MADEKVDYQNVGLEQIDQAIFDWFNKTVDAHVDYPNGERKKVPVNFATGERWVTSTAKKGIRDANGVLILPIISLRRTTVEFNQTMSALGVETPNLQISKLIHKKTNNLKNLDGQRLISARGLDTVVYEVTTIPFPDSSILMYDIVVQTQYITQMNAILEKVFHSLDIGKSFVAPIDNSGRHPPNSEEFEERKPLTSNYVVGFIEGSANDNGNIEEFTDQERIIKYNTSIRVPSTLLLDPEGTKPSVRTHRTSSRLDFGDEQVCLVDDPEELDIIFGKKR